MLSDTALLALLVISFGVIIALVANKKNFAISVLLGAFLLSIAIPQKIPDVFTDTVKDIGVLSLIAIVVMIKLLATILQESGQMQELILYLQKRLSYQNVIVIFPTILGLLPVPGGALMSAPLVGEQGKHVGMKNDQMMFINLWYRHIWFLIFPLAPPLLLIADLSGENIYGIILFQVPLFIFAFVVGYLFVRKISTIPSGSKANVEPAGNLKGLVAILVAVGIALILSMVLEGNFPFLIALPFGIITAYIFSKNKSVNIIKKGLSITLAVSIFGIMFFKNIIGAAGITDILSSYFSNEALLLVSIPLFSFIIGLLTANNLAAITILFPIFEQSLTNTGIVSLLYISTFIGYLVSPIHPCIALSYEYFEHPKFLKLYRLLLPASLALMAVALAIYLSLYGIS